MHTRSIPTGSTPTGIRWVSSIDPPLSRTNDTPHNRMGSVANGNSCIPPLAVIAHTRIGRPGCRRLGWATRNNSCAVRSVTIRRPYPPSSAVRIEICSPSINPPTTIANCRCRRRVIIPPGSVTHRKYHLVRPGVITIDSTRESERSGTTLGTGNRSGIATIACLGKCAGGASATRIRSPRGISARTISRTIYGSGVNGSATVRLGKRIRGASATRIGSPIRSTP